MPGIAPAAKQAGRYVAKVIGARIADARHGLSATATPATSRPSAARRRSPTSAGWPVRRAAWLLWGLAHVYFLIGFRNRLVVALDWLWAYATFDRGARLITGRSDD